MLSKIGLCGALFISGVTLAAGQQIDVIDEELLSQCRSYAWYPHEKIPVFDPYYIADREETRTALEEVQRQIREGADDRFGKRGWMKVGPDEADCLIQYSLIQELDLEIAPNQSGQIAPTKTDGFDGGIATAAASLNLERRGTLTIEIVPRDSEEWIWMGTLEDSLGKPDSVPKNAKKLAQKIAEKVPRRR